MGETLDYIEQCIGFAECLNCGWMADESADCYLPDTCPQCGSHNIEIYLEEG